MMKRLLPFFYCIILFIYFTVTLSADVSGESDDSAQIFRRTVQRFSSRQIMETFALAYPRRIERSAFRDGDWGVEIDGKWFLFAGGRMLPEEVVRDPAYDSSKYAPYPFYTYTKDLPAVRVLSKEEQQRLDNRLTNQKKNPPYRHPGFFNAIWRITSSDTAWERMKTTYFLGKKMLIHRELLEDLAGIEDEILLLSKTNTNVEKYVASLASATGFNYRKIAGTNSLSFHSYGFAVDVIPYSYRGKEVYWRWAYESGLEWFNLPYEKRYMPPEEIINIWERHGFIWGGKWFFFDNMHFEYRPEILMLNGISFEVN